MMRPSSFLHACCISVLVLATPALARQSGAPPVAPRSVQVAETAFTRGDAVPAWVDDVREIPPPLKGGPLSVRLADVQFHVAQQSQSAVYAHRALTANEAASLSALGQYEISFQPEYQRVQLHSLRILRGGQVIDKLKSADIRFLQRETSLDQGLYSGTVTAAIVTEDVRVGDTLELAYSVIGQNPVFEGKFFEAASWDSPAPLSLRRVSIDMPQQRTIHYRMVGAGAALKPAETIADGRRILRFEARGMPALLGEPYVPRDVHGYRFIQFSEMDNWREVNRWALGLFETAPAGPALEEALRGARQAATLPDKVSKVLEFVQNDIRYLSLSMGENSHRPYPPAQVLQRRYGDCKDKTLLMVTMLHALGVEAHPVLVSTASRKGLEQMLPSPTLFDHAIVRARVQGKTYYFDPTRLGQYGALDRMGQVHGGAQVLAVAAGSEALEYIPYPADAALYTDQRSERVVVNALDKPAELRAHLEYAGADAENGRVQLANISTQQLRKVYEASMGRRYTEFALLDEPRITDDRVNNRLSIDLRYRIDKFMEKDERGWQMRYRPSNLMDQLYVPDVAQRALPLQVPFYPAIHTYDFEVTLPPEVDAHYAPSQNTVSSSGFTLTEALSFNGRLAQARLRMETTSDRVAAAEVPAFVGAARKMNEALQGSLYVKTGIIKAGAAPDYKQATLARIEATVKATTKVLDDAALTGQDPGGAWCERARAYSLLGRNAEALKDAARAVQQQGDSWENLACRGEAAFAAGNFKDSAADFARAVALGSNDSGTWLLKGWADLYQGNKREALNDFARAGKAASDPLGQTRVRIWEAIGGAPAGPRPAAADLPLTETWLSAALEMFQSQGAPEQMLRLASRDGASGLESRLAEAYFYAGKSYLMAQDKLRARVYFQRAIDKGALTSRYHQLARLELARLP
jgi:transglutaminase-like putative cysteine protease/tetratricopeptide (TPR) repeat protein